MLKNAIIKDITDNLIRVALLPDDCNRHSGCKGCGMCSNQSSAKELLELNIPAVSGLNKGDIVEINLKAPRGAKIAVVLYMLPLILMFIGGHIGNIIAASSGMIIGGAAGLVLAVAIIYILNRTLLKVKGILVRKL